MLKKVEKYILTLMKPTKSLTQTVPLTALSRTRIDQLAAKTQTVL